MSQRERDPVLGFLLHKDPLTKSYTPTEKVAYYHRYARRHYRRGYYGYSYGYHRPYYGYRYRRPYYGYGYGRRWRY